MITASERNYLLENMEELLDEYDYNYSTRALNKIIDTWAENKAELITAFKNHPNYLEGKFMIAFDADYERKIDTTQSAMFTAWLLSENGPIKTMRNTLPEEIKRKMEIQECVYLENNVWRFLTALEAYAQRTISEDLANFFNEHIPEIHAHAGQKTSRVVNKLCTYLGYNKHPEYNREFAKYADSLSPLSIKRHTVLSLNPLDYLTMSFGNSWASCHTIDKRNQRDMPDSYEGMYSSGTVSYMLDPSSMVLYTVDASYNGNDYWSEPKINRQMFHWGARKLVQGRLYPQDNDGCKDLYTQSRAIVQDIISKIFDFPNFWTVHSGTSNASQYVYSEGTHYRDYQHFSNCTLSRIKGEENEGYFTIGHDPICIECGYEHRKEGCISCCSVLGGYTCADCGRGITEDDVYWIDGEAYCSDCVRYCECCEEYVREGNTTWIESEHRYVCESCLSEYYTYCEHCEEYHDRGNMNYLERYGIDVCDDCLSRLYEECCECGEYALRSEAIFIDGDYYCDDCVIACASCGEVKRMNDMEIINGKCYCENCAEEMEEEHEQAI